MRGNSFYVSPLSDTELSNLAGCIGVFDRSSMDWKRAWSILLSAAGLSAYRIGKVNGIQPQTITRWLMDYELSKVRGE